MRNTKHYNYLNLISFKIVPMCTLLPATVKVLETSWKPFCESLFSSFVAFLMKPLASQKRRPFCSYCGGGNRQKSAGARSGEWGGEMFQCFYIVLRWEVHHQKRTVYWNIVKEKPANSYVRSSQHNWVFQVFNKATCFDPFNRSSSG